MTSKDAERIIHRRARALGLRRQHHDETGAVDTSLLVRPEDGAWVAIVRAMSGTSCLVDVRARAADPTAALLALPGELERHVREACALLLGSLRVGPDTEVDEEPAAAPPAPAMEGKHRAPPRCGKCGSATHRSPRCPEQGGGEVVPAGLAPGGGGDGA